MYESLCLVQALMIVHHLSHGCGHASCCASRIEVVYGTHVVVWRVLIPLYVAEQGLDFLVQDVIFFGCGCRLAVSYICNLVNVSGKPVFNMCRKLVIVECSGVAVSQNRAGSVVGRHDNEAVCCVIVKHIKAFFAICVCCCVSQLQWFQH